MYYIYMSVYQKFDVSENSMKNVDQELVGGPNRPLSVDSESVAHESYSYDETTKMYVCFFVMNVSSRSIIKEFILLNIIYMHAHIIMILSLLYFNF